MTIAKITETTPACYGVTCPQHGRCARYAAVEHTPVDHTIATCCDAAGARPLFVELKAERTAS